MNNDQGKRILAFRIAREMRDARWRHGGALSIRPEMSGGVPAVRFSGPIHGDVARRLIAGLNRLREGADR
jgi:hypothetical protein